MINWQAENRELWRDGQTLVARAEVGPYRIAIKSNPLTSVACIYTIINYDKSTQDILCIDSDEAKAKAAQWIKDDALATLKEVAEDEKHSA